MTNPHPDFFTIARSGFFGALCRTEHDIPQAREHAAALAKDLEDGIGVNDKGEPVAARDGVRLKVADASIQIDKEHSEIRRSILVVDGGGKTVIVPGAVRGETIPLVLSTGAAKLAVALSDLDDRDEGDRARILAHAITAAMPMLARTPSRLDVLRAVLARAIVEALAITGGETKADPGETDAEKADRIAKLKAELAELGAS